MLSVLGTAGTPAPHNTRSTKAPARRTLPRCGNGGARTTYTDPPTYKGGLELGLWAAPTLQLSQGLGKPNLSAARGTVQVSPRQKQSCPSCPVALAPAHAPPRRLLSVCLVWALQASSLPTKHPHPQPPWPSSQDPDTQPSTPATPGPSVQVRPGLSKASRGPNWLVPLDRRK